MLEGNGFHVFLDPGRDLRLVAPCVQVVQVGGHGGEEIGDFGLVGGDLFGDGGGYGCLELADSWGICTQSLRGERERERERESKMGKYRMDGRIPLKGEDPAEL